MSWKGFQKAVSRLPQRLLSATGHAEETKDPEYDDIEARFHELENFTTKLNENAKRYKQSLEAMFKHQQQFATVLAEVLQPISSGSLKNSAGTDGNIVATHESVSSVQALIHQSDAMKERILPDLDQVIDRQVVQPTNDLMTLHKMIAKTLIKREHKMVDYDRHRDNYMKVYNKPNRSQEDDRKMIKLQMANDQAEREFSRWNMMIKEQLPLYIEYRVQFIDPVFRALMNFQLRMFSQMLTIYQELSKELGVQPGPIIDRFEKAIEAPREAIMALRIISNPMAIEQNARTSQGSFTSGPGSPIKSGASSPERPYTSASGGPPPYSGSGAPPIAEKPRTAGPPPISSKPSMGGNSNVNPIMAAAGSAAYSAARANPAAAFSLAQSAAGPASSMMSQSAGYTASPAVIPRTSIKPTMNQPEYVVALYDYSAQAEGDLSFCTDDKIEIVKKTDSKNDWWTGKVRGQTGVFPANYVRT